MININDPERAEIMKEFFSPDEFFVINQALQEYKLLCEDKAGNMSNLSGINTELKETLRRRAIISGKLADITFFPQI
jgi:hypothetical protein